MNFAAVRIPDKGSYIFVEGCDFQADLWTRVRIPMLQHMLVCRRPPNIKDVNKLDQASTSDSLKPLVNRSPLQK